MLLALILGPAHFDQEAGKSHNKNNKNNRRNKLKNLIIKNDKVIDEHFWSLKLTGEGGLGVWKH